MEVREIKTLVISMQEEEARKYFKNFDDIKLLQNLNTLKNNINQTMLLKHIQRDQCVEIIDVKKLEWSFDLIKITIDVVVK